MRLQKTFIESESEKNVSGFQKVSDASPKPMHCLRQSVQLMIMGHNINRFPWQRIKPALMLQQWKINLTIKYPGKKNSDAEKWKPFIAELHHHYWTRIPIMPLGITGDNSWWWNSSHTNNVRCLTTIVSWKTSCRNRRCSVVPKHVSSMLMRGKCFKLSRWSTDIIKTVINLLLAIY